VGSSRSNDARHRARDDAEIACHRVILFASYSGAHGGAERLLIDCARGLDGEVALACPEGALGAAARGAGLRVFPTRRRSLAVRTSVQDRLTGPLRLGGHARELDRLVTTTEPELLVLWGMRSALAWLLLARRSAPGVVFQHNDFLPGPLIARAVRRAAGRADLVIALSHAVGRDLDPGGVLGDRVRVVHPGVDTGRLAADEAPRDPPHALLLGALVDWKRPDVALEAVALARRRRPELRLRIVGEALESDIAGALHARASAPDLEGAVDFVGAVPDPRGELARATCLLHCASREPFGLAVLEAMAAGRPVVVPEGSGPDEIVDDACAIRYPATDAPAAARALARVAGEPGLAEAMGRAGRRRARERFELTASQERWARTLERVRAPRHPPPRAPSLELVTVTHNSASVVGSLLGSVQRHLPDVGVVVVDSGSSDDTVAIARRSAVARVIELGRNVGFGVASNRGLAEVEAEVTGLVNPDVELIDSSLLELAVEAGRHERLLAPRVIGTDGAVQDSVHPAPGSLPELLRSVIPFTLLPARITLPLAPWRSRVPRRVGWAVGCALVARTDTLRRLGPFDERLFLYGEDLELALRATDAGIATCFWPSARVVHHRAHATSAAFGGEPFELLVRGRRDALALRRSSRAVILDDVAQALSFTVRIGAKRLLGRSATRERRQLAALRAVRREAKRPRGS
jgi:N-acetylglucosaminyl-diphospho-decaprenol L-rhamnosyltransferase